MIDGMTMMSYWNRYALGVWFLVYNIQKNYNVPTRDKAQALATTTKMSASLESWNKKKNNTYEVIGGRIVRFNYHFEC